MSTKNNIQFLKICSELGAGTRGASKGFEGLRTAATKKNSDLFKKFNVTAIKDENESLLKNINFSNAKRIKQIYAVLIRVHDEVKTQIKKKKFPILLSGDHSIASGTIAGIKSAYPSKQIGVVWIDAHADIHSPYTTPSGNMHGMPIAASLGIDCELNKQNTPHLDVKKLWEDIKNLGGFPKKIKPENLVYVGVRETEWQEDEIIKELNIQNYSIDFIRKNGGKSTSESILNQLINCDCIYISFDVDVLDTSLSRGTGTPVPNGLFLREVINIIKGIAQSNKLCCFEIVEINPTIDDKGNLMAEMGIEVLEALINEIE
jgi:arginase